MTRMGGGNFEKREEQREKWRERKRKARVHTFVAAAQRDYLRPAIAFARWNKEASLLTRISFEIAESFARKRRIPVQAGCGRREEKEFIHTAGLAPPFSSGLLNGQIAAFIRPHRTNLLRNFVISSLISSNIATNIVKSDTQLFNLLHWNDVSRTSTTFCPKIAIFSQF